MGKRLYFMETKEGKIYASIEFNPLWSKYQVFEDGSLYAEFNNIADCDKYLKNGGWREQI